MSIPLNGRHDYGQVSRENAHTSIKQSSITDTAGSRPLLHVCIIQWYVRTVLCHLVIVEEHAALMHVQSPEQLLDVSGPSFVPRKPSSDCQCWHTWDEVALASLEHT